MSKAVDSITIEVRPTVTLESAVACVMMVNMFLRDNEGYRLELAENDARDGMEWRITDEPLVPATGGVYVRPLTNMEFTEDEKEILANMPALRKLAKMAGLECE